MEENINSENNQEISNNNCVSKGAENNNENGSGGSWLKNIGIIFTLVTALVTVLNFSYEGEYLFKIRISLMLYFLTIVSVGISIFGMMLIRNYINVYIQEFSELLKIKWVSNIFKVLTIIFSSIIVCIFIFNVYSLYYDSIGFLELYIIINSFDFIILITILIINFLNLGKENQSEETNKKNFDKNHIFRMFFIISIFSIIFWASMCIIPSILELIQNFKVYGYIRLNYIICIVGFVIIGGYYLLESLFYFSGNNVNEDKMSQGLLKLITLFFLITIYNVLFCLLLMSFMFSLFYITEINGEKIEKNYIFLLNIYYIIIMLIINLYTFKNIKSIEEKKEFIENNKVRTFIKKLNITNSKIIISITIFLIIINNIVIKNIFDLPNVLEEYRINYTKQLYKEVAESLINRNTLEENTEYIAEDENLNNEESLENSEVTNIMSEYNLDDFDIEIFEEMKKMEKINDAYNAYLNLENQAKEETEDLK